MTSSPRATPSPFGSPLLSRRARTPLDALGLDIAGVSPRPGTPNKSATPSNKASSPAASWTAQVEALMSGSSSRPGTPTSHERASSRALGKIRDVGLFLLIIRHVNTRPLDDPEPRYNIIHPNASSDIKATCELRASRDCLAPHRRWLRNNPFSATVRNDAAYSTVTGIALALLPRHHAAGIRKCLIDAIQFVCWFYVFATYCHTSHRWRHDVG